MILKLADALQTIVDYTKDMDIHICSVVFGIDENVVDQLYVLGYIKCDMCRNVWMTPQGISALENHKNVKEDLQYDVSDY